MSHSESSSKITCTFVAGVEKYKAVVNGTNDTLRQFIIIYRLANTCLSYSLNLPLYVELEPN